MPLNFFDYCSIIIILVSCYLAGPLNQSDSIIFTVLYTQVIIKSNVFCTNLSQKRSQFGAKMAEIHSFYHKNYVYFQFQFFITIFYTIKPNS
jgi:hypothetical protein